MAGVPAPTLAPAPDRAPDWVAAGTPPDLHSRLAAVLGEEQVLARATDLVRFASDASPYRLIPQVVVRPRDAADVATLLRAAADLGRPVVFRAGGTSLNGQSQTDGILADVRHHFQRMRVQDGGALARVQPGVTLGLANRRLIRHHRRLGPDPASTNIACVGGVVANNSGGMRCGVTADAYSTVRAMTLVLANGAVIDTAAADGEQRFADAAPELAAGLLEIRDTIRGDAELSARIARKFEIKNTTGYRLCAFLDADTPLEIFRRLIIGSEGTLAFVAEAVFETVPHGPHSSLGLVFFDDLDAAAAAVEPLVAAGATATELMVAPTLIAAAYNMPGTPAAWKELPPTSAALLIEFRADDPSGLDAPEATAAEILAGRPLIGGDEAVRFTRDAEEVELLWRVREGMQGLLAAIRPPGVTLIIEDVCVPPARVAEAARDLQALLGEHGFLQGLAGHASAGNLHFLLTLNFSDSDDTARYDRFMHALVDLIVDKYDGSLKAEHGTGLNMAPFVAREWGETATELMWRVKALADPHGVLGPGVLLNRDPDVHLHNLASTPEIEAEATKCIECGFCEPVCPSRGVTTTPRQRIVLRREMARQPEGSPVLTTLLEQYDYDALQTCATDSSCAAACPVAIDTGALVKRLRTAQHSPRAQRAALGVARRYAAAERAARAGLRAAGVAARVAGDARVAALTRALRRTPAAPDLIPQWDASVPAPAPARLPSTTRDGAAAVYLPSCLNRIFGPSRQSPGPSVPEALVTVSRRAGLPVWIPDDVAGHCCGTPWSSKGYTDGHALMTQRTAAAIRRWSEDGRLPVVIDASSCTLGVIGELGLEGIEVLDSVSWVHDRLLERLPVTHRLGRLAVHATCACSQLGLAGRLAAVAATLADEVVVPAAGGCCGMAGDRGLLHPELPAAALSATAAELSHEHLDGAIASNRTCEIALHRETGYEYRSLVLTLEELTR
ncbi:MAG TPA: FAD-binding and (Fe-S)-binding domain-containing protein [Solirubrobacteraceae bacterium]|nr:FAD-binding and (Fe-S)-binding domain-containing protein [Solirubrobacteraceae bacterium]